MIKIENLFYSPVKSISFEESESLNVLTDRGIESDRIFAFVQNLDSNSIKNFIEDPKSRKLNNFLTLKNSPELNQYNFKYAENKQKNCRNLTLRLKSRNGHRSRLGTGHTDSRYPKCACGRTLTAHSSHTRRWTADRLR